MPKCRECGNELPFFYRGWEIVCPRCGVRHPSISSLTVYLALQIAALLLGFVHFFYRPMLLTVIFLAVVALAIAYVSVHIMILRKRRKSSESLSRKTLSDGSV